MTSRVSRRAARLSAAPSPLVVAHFACAADPFDAQSNPGGYVNLGTAENFLLWDVVGPRLATYAPREKDVHYDTLHGTAALREGLARLMTSTSGVPVEAGRLAVVSGASAALDILATALCEAGEAMVVPAPYYPGFRVDVAGRADVRLVPAPLSSADGFALSPKAVEAALARARAEGVRVKAVLLTSPVNPLGRTHAPEVLAAIVDLARREDLDLVVDEVYAGSVFGSRPFLSALALRDRWPGRVHVVYSLAKDLGLSGLKVGILHTDDDEVLAAAHELASLAPVSTGTQAMLAHALADAAWVGTLAAENRKRLAKAYRDLMMWLGQSEIANIPADAGVFVWLDLRRSLSAPTWEAERALAARILAAKVNLSPGEAFGCPEPGFFRLCYAQRPEVVREGVARLARALR